MGDDCTEQTCYRSNQKFMLALVKRLELITMLSKGIYLN
jgi:hypothetical protein